MPARHYYCIRHDCQQQTRPRSSARHPDPHTSTDSLVNERFETHIRAENSGQTALDLLAGHTSLTKRQLKAATASGAVWLESRRGIRRIRRAKKSLTPGDTQHLYYDSRIQSQAAGGAVLVADEGDYSVWNKPYGMYSQGTRWGDHCTIYRWAET